MHVKFPLILLFYLSSTIFGDDVKVIRRRTSKDLLREDVKSVVSEKMIGNERKGRFFGLLSLLAGLSLTDGLFFDTDSWTDNPKAGAAVNINTKLQAAPYGIGGLGWPFGPRYVPVLIPASYFAPLKHEALHQQIVNVDSPVKMESYQEAPSLGQHHGNQAAMLKNIPTPERFIREAVEIANNATVVDNTTTTATVVEIQINETTNQTNESQVMQPEVEVAQNTSDLVENSPESQTSTQSIVETNNETNSQTSQMINLTTEMSFEVGMQPESEAAHLENLMVNEVEEMTPPSWKPSGNSSYYRKYPQNVNIDDISFTTIYPPLGTPPPDVVPFQASPKDETTSRRVPQSFQPILQVPIFWGNRL
ncbi:uncharacterized protein LOC129794654 isoform X2 [Lutzomyia longipalpis]|uniref:uncharacterized protein LOC129794654 isoform X2 n=1 Tax=Lutzomyia longipalpis TaxID=7200 RepID=UPI0024844409|nr:uncharacterized protein LOC129794654 isoform X2 [Lutzomyia longipalpis]